MEDNKNEQKQEILIRRGSFRIGYANEKKLIVLCILGMLLCLCMFVGGLIAFGVPQDFLGFMCGVFWIIPFFLCLIIVPVLVYGRRCKYYTAEKEMEIITPTGRDYLYYSDISEVIYKSFRLFKRQRGYKITVVTGVRDYTYNLLFDSISEFTLPEYTPFYILELNSGLKKPVQPDPEFSAAIMSQFAVMQEKQEDRLSKKRKKKTWENLFDDIDIVNIP